MGAVTTFESSFEANGAGDVRRLDVIPAGPARRRWSAEAKARIIAESLGPGINVSAVARRHGLFPQQLYAWRRQVGDRIEGSDGSAFVPAMVEQRARALCPASADAEIRIEIKGVNVFVPEAASADHVERVLLAVQVMGMIVPSGALKVLVAVKPVDFRKGMVGLAALVEHELERDPFSGTLFVFRCKRADRIKLLLWDGTGLVLVSKRLQTGRFRWPRFGDGVMTLTAAQAAALIEGLDWSRVHAPRVARPVMAQ